jgi:hypothetical protein
MAALSTSAPISLKATSRPSTQKPRHPSEAPRCGGRPDAHQRPLKSIFGDRMRIQSRHSRAARGLEAYWTPPEAIASLLGIEAAHLPPRLCLIWEPAAGTGAIVRPLQAAGHEVIASDVADYVSTTVRLASITSPRNRPAAFRLS